MIGKTELIEKFMMDLLPADDSDGDRWQDNLPDTDVEIDIGGDKKRPTQPREYKSGVTALEKTVVCMNLTN